MVWLLVTEEEVLRTSYTQAISCARAILASLVIRQIDAIDLRLAQRAFFMISVFIAELTC